MRPKRVQQEKAAVEVVEEALQLLRSAPASALVAYYLGALPFVLALLFFWSDMARSAFASQRLISGTIGLSLIFIWMKGWQSVFARHLLVGPSGRIRPFGRLGCWRSCVLGLDDSEYAAEQDRRNQRCKEHRARSSTHGDNPRDFLN